jgi:hypothetical protein
MNIYRTISTIGSVSVLLLFAGCAQQPTTVQTGPGAETIGDGLYKVDNSRVDEAYMDPDVDFARFEDIFIVQLDVSNVNIVQPQRSSMPGRQIKWELTEEDRSVLQNIYLDKMYRYLFDRGAYQEAEQPGENTLTVKIAITQIAPTASKDDGSRRNVSRGATYTEGAGSISIKGVLKDGSNGKIIAVFSDTRGSSSFWGENNRVKNLSEVKYIFDFWAQLFQYRLDELNGKV